MISRDRGEAMALQADNGLSKGRKGEKCFGHMEVKSSVCLPQIRWQKYRISKPGHWEKSH